MTSTPFNVGLGDGSRLSSRVLRPPGGGHTDIFGGDPEPPRGRRPAPSTVTEQAKEPAKSTNGTEVSNQNGQQQVQATTDTAKEANKVVEPKTENHVQNEKPIEKNNSEPPKRTRVPPGGYSSGFW